MREREREKNLWSVTDIENGLSELIFERELEKKRESLREKNRKRQTKIESVRT